MLGNGDESEDVARTVKFNLPMPQTPKGPAVCFEDANPKEGLRHPTTPHHSVFNSQEDMDHWFDIKHISEAYGKSPEEVANLLGMSEQGIKVLRQQVFSESEEGHTVPTVTFGKLDTTTPRAKKSVSFKDPNPKLHLHKPTTPHHSVFNSQEDLDSWFDAKQLSAATGKSPEEIAELLGLGEQGLRMLRSQVYHSRRAKQELLAEPELEQPPELHQPSIEFEDSNRSNAAPPNKKKGHKCVPACFTCRPMFHLKKRLSTKQLRETMKAHALVDILIRTIESGNEWTFDYVLLVIVGAFLSALGLGTNSSVIVVASMLVSPLMGPLLAITFGVVCGQRQMVKKGFWNEVASLFLCIVCGFISGMALGSISVLDFPTTEMSLRGESVTFVGGIFVALLSGVGVALSVAGQNTSCLVGVAISASLLPPAVNTGMFLGYELVLRMQGQETQEFTNLVYAGWSFALVLINCLLIVVFGVIIFKIKEIAPFENKPIVFEFGLKAKREENRRLRHDEHTEKRVHFDLPEEESMRDTSSMYQSSASSNSPKYSANMRIPTPRYIDDLEAQSSGRLRRSRTCGSEPAFSVRRKNSSSSMFTYARSDMDDVLDALPKELLLRGDLQHSLRTLPSSAV